MPVNDLRENPAKWVSQTLTKNWDRIQDEVAPDFYPLLHLGKTVGKKGQLSSTMEELGCGAYGCVLETNDAGVVLKITTDEGEYDYATKVQTKVEAPGIVQYLGDLRLEGSYKGRGVYALWREEAENVGKILEKTDDAATDGLIDQSWWVGTWTWQRMSLHEDANGLYEAALREDLPAIRRKVEEWTLAGRRGTYERGKTITKWLTGEWANDNAYALALALCFLARTYWLMAQTIDLGLVGEAFLELGKHGYLITDAHEGNMGQVDRDGVPTWVVTDPGHLVVLPSPWPTR